MTDYLAATNPHKRDAEIEFDEKPHPAVETRDFEEY